MGFKRLLKRGGTLFLGIIIFTSILGFPSLSALVDARIPVIDDGMADGDERAAIYWNPGTEGEDTGLATSSNASDVIGLATSSNAAAGLTPDTAVKNLNHAVRQAEKLSRLLGSDIQDAVIYAMSPMIIPTGLTYAVDGKGISIVPWENNIDDDSYIFIVEGGRLSLSHITIRPDDWTMDPEDSALIYMSSGVIQLGKQAESYGTFVLDYSQLVSHPKPVIELTDQFDFASYFSLNLFIHDELEDDITVIQALHPDRSMAEEFKAVFPLVDPGTEWELCVIEQVLGDPAEATQKSLVIRRLENSISGWLWLDENSDSVADCDEEGIAGYPVSLYREDDLNTEIQNTVTKGDGTYRFAGMEPGRYVVGIAQEIVDDNQYLLPRGGITGDNKFSLAEIDGVEIAYSETTVFTTDFVEAVININAGLNQIDFLHNLLFSDPPPSTGVVMNNSPFMMMLYMAMTTLIGALIVKITKKIVLQDTRSVK